jgi:hypothetical protein
VFVIMGLPDSKANVHASYHAQGDVHFKSHYNNPKILPRRFLTIAVFAGGFQLWATHIGPTRNFALHYDTSKFDDAFTVDGADLVGDDLRPQSTDVQGPRVHAELCALGVRCGRKRVARLMCAASLVGAHRRRPPRTTWRDRDQAAAPDLVQRRFTTPAPNRLWGVCYCSLRNRSGRRHGEWNVWRQIHTPR